MVSRAAELGQPQVRSPAGSGSRLTASVAQRPILRILPSVKHPKVTPDTKYPTVWKVLFQLI